jgi:ELWxxDGT repeat protein
MGCARRRRRGRRPSIFAADDGDGVEPWHSDGTAAGTAQLLDINPGATDVYGYDGVGASFADVDGTLVFVGYDRENGRRLWKSDGTEAGTVPIGPIEAFDTPPLVAVGGRICFMEYRPESGESRGSRRSTARFASCRPQSRFAEPTPWPLVALRASCSSASTTESTGANPGRREQGLVADLEPGPPSSDPREPVRSTGVCISLPPDRSGRPTAPPGTTLVADIDAGYDARMIAGTDRLAVITSAPDGQSASIWYSDGSPEGTTRVAELASVGFPPGNETFGSDAWPRPVAFVGRMLLFSVGDQAHGVELWRSDGTPSGTGLLADINPGRADAALGAAVSRGDAALFFADDGTHGLEPWISDGTAAGTRLLRDVLLGPLGSRTRGDDSQIAIGDAFVFAASDGTHGLELWRSD